MGAKFTYKGVVPNVVIELTKEADLGETDGFLQNNDVVITRGGLRLRFNSRIEERKLFFRFDLLNRQDEHKLREFFRYSTQDNLFAFDFDTEWGKREFLTTSTTRNDQPITTGDLTLEECGVPAEVITTSTKVVSDRVTFEDVLLDQNGLVFSGALPENRSCALRMVQENPPR